MNAKWVLFFFSFKRMVSCYLIFVFIVLTKFVDGVLFAFNFLYLESICFHVIFRVDRYFFFFFCCVVCSFSSINRTWLVYDVKRQAVTKFGQTIMWLFFLRGIPKRWMKKKQAAAEEWMLPTLLVNNTVTTHKHNYIDTFTFFLFLSHSPVHHSSNDGGRNKRN